MTERPFRLLTRHFFRRFLDNDLVSPDADSHANVALFLALLIAPNLVGSVLLLFVYANQGLTSSQRLLLGLSDKLAFLCTSMILTALVTVIEWDALWLDARDNAILRPLPIRARTLVGAKLAALGLFVATVAALVNAAHSILFPLIWLGTTPVGLGVVLTIVVVHALVSLGSAVFAFTAVLVVRGLLVAALPPRACRVASSVVQFAAILLLVCAFLLSPALYHDAGTKVASRSRIVLGVPPTWFLGLYEHLTAQSMLNTPPVRADRGLSEWWQREDQKARSTYVAIEPVLERLAARAVIGLGLLPALALGLLALAHLRRATDLSRTVTARGRPRWQRRAGAVLARLLGGRQPIARATFVFTLLTLVRSARHRLYIAGYLAGGIALVVVGQDPRLLRGTAAPATGPVVPEPGLLALQLVLVFALIVGVRVGLPIPAELKANWIFRVVEPADVRPALAGAGRAFRTLVVGLLALLVPWHVAVWGWHLATRHFLAGGLIALVLVEGVLISFPNVPFTVPYVPGNSKLRYMWPVYLCFFWAFTSLVAFLEFHAMQSAFGFGTFAACLVLVLVGLAWTRRRNLQQLPGLTFNEEEERAVQTLGLMP
jgi:hypothetical protein